MVELREECFAHVPIFQFKRYHDSQTKNVDIWMSMTIFGNVINSMRKLVASLLFGIIELVI